MTWGNSTNVLNYSFTYDGVNRMLNAEYSEGGYMNQNLDRYTEKVTEYDKNGNILGLQRYGQTGASSYGLVDNLTYTYNGNKLTRVDGATTATSYTILFQKECIRRCTERIRCIDGTNCVH